MILFFSTGYLRRTLLIKTKILQFLANIHKIDIEVVINLSSDTQIVDIGLDSLNLIPLYGLYVIDFKFKNYDNKKYTWDNSFEDKLFKVDLKNIY